jgi:hypothetical protein
MIVPNIQQRLWQGVRRAWRTIARASLGAGLGGIVIGEVLGVFFNGGHNTFFLHLISLVLGLALAYGAAVTVGIFQAIRGVFTVVEDLEREVRSAMGDQYSRTIDAERKEA